MCRLWCAFINIIVLWWRLPWCMCVLLWVWQWRLMIEPTPGNIPRTCYFVKIKLVWLVFCLMRRCTCQFLVEVNKSTRSQPWIVLALNTIVKSEVNSLALWPSGTILTSSKTWISYHSLSFTLNAELPSGTAGQRQVVQHCRRDGAVPECRLHHHQQQDHWPRHTNLQHSQRVLLSTFTVISLKHEREWLCYLFFICVELHYKELEDFHVVMQIYSTLKEFWSVRLQHSLTYEDGKSLLPLDEWMVSLTFFSSFFLKCLLQHYKLQNHRPRHTNLQWLTLNGFCSVRLLQSVTYRPGKGTALLSLHE